jgi:signal transduction histidine kinase
LRIRQKLMLGLGLVLVPNALMLAGTIYGFSSFRATMKAIESKHAELEAAETLKTQLATGKKRLQESTQPGEDQRIMSDTIAKARADVKKYQEQLDDTVNRGRDPDNGEDERRYVGWLNDGFAKLEQAVNAAGSRPAIVQRTGGGPPRLLDDKVVSACLDKVVGDSGDLRDKIQEHLSQRSKDTRRTFATSIWIVASISVGGVLLLFYLLSAFYAWLFYPVRDLQEGASRVAQGDFEYRIEVHSGDELEDLAHVFNDMTDRLREMYRDLARQVNERSRQLVRSERLASVGFLAAGVAHEINNPLASIAFCSEALEQRLGEVISRGGSSGDVIVKYLKMIQQEAFRCKSITQRLLEFSRGGERRREPTDLADLVQGVLDMVQHLQNGKGKHIVFDPPGRVTAWVNSQEVKSVVLNLVVNALDSMDEGGTLVITLAPHADMAELTFADSGCGMTAEVLENIFEPFFTRSRTGKGTGLGLAISHRVISQHGGEIEAISPGPGRGSTFTVRLPLKPAEPIKEEALGHAAA